MDLGLKGKKALVMGSSTGIGYAIAQSLLRDGADVALCARDPERLARAAKELGARVFFVCDLGQTGQGHAVVKKAIEALGGLDILVTNTGGPKKGAFSDVSEAQWRQDFQTVWMSAVEAFQGALPHMKERGYGRLLMVTSLAAKEPLPGLTTSNGLRAGLAGLGKSIANEYARFGITVNLLLPGYTNTERLKDLNLSSDKIREMVPAARLGEPEEIGDLAAFLASPRAGYITGQSIAIDGGALRGH